MINSLKGKISLVYLYLVIIIAVIGLASVINLYKLSGSIDGLMTANYKSINAINNMIEALESQDSAVLIYIDIDKQKGIDMFSENQNTFNKWFDIEKNNITEPGEQELVENTDLNYAKYVKYFLQLQEIKNNQEGNKSVDFYNSTITPEFNKLKQQLKALSQLNEKAMFYGKNTATQNAQQSMYIILILTLIAIIGGFLTSRFFINRFLKPIYSLTETVKLVKAGGLYQQTDLISNDEAGELASEFNKMTRRLKQYEQSALGIQIAEKNRFTAVVKNISDPLIVMDTSYKILILNNVCKTFFDITEEKTLNKHFLEVIRNGELFDYITEAFKANAERSEKIIVIKSKDEEYYLNVVVTTVKDMENNLSGIIVLFQNVTALKQFEKMRTDFIATISHEFKTPLTSMMMGTDLLLNDRMGELNDEQKSITTALKEDCERLTSLVNEMLELSKIESAKAILEIKPCSIAVIIENSFKQFNQLAERKEVILEFDADEDLPKVFADYEKITWVLNNLISNALKYTNAGDNILISSFIKDNEMYVSVKDTGIGIPEEYKEKIFHKFFQVKDNDLEIRGTGLGLAVAKEIIEIHGGKMWCESKLDMGSIFTFTLKVNKQEEAL